MRKLFSIFTLIASVAMVVSCKPDTPEPEPQPKPQPGTKPEITLTAGEVLANSFTFEVSTTVAGELGYAVVAEGNTNPTIDEIFARNTATVESKATITIEELNDNTNYTLFAILRATDGGTLSDPKKLTFTTPDDGVDNPITIDEVGYDNATFTINLPGRILFQCIDKAYLDTVGQTIESYFRTEGIAIRVDGPLTVEWVNGNYYDAFEMRMREDSEYYVIAATCDSTTPYPNITGEIFYKSFKTLRKPTSEAGITTQLKDITSTSVTIATEPDASVVSYYVMVRDKVWSDGIVDGYGEAMLLNLVKNPSAGSWTLNATNEDTWAGLQPETDYYCHIVVIDDKGAEALTRIEFTTTAKTLGDPEIELSVTDPTTNPHNSLNLNLYCENAAEGKVVFRPTADVAERRAEGYSDEQLVNYYGRDLSGEQISAIASTGLTILMEDLWPEVEYTVIVSIKNIEKSETIKATTHTTSKQAAAPRVESDLFTSLLGEWELTYTLVQENLLEVTVTETVTIAQGVDDKSNADYRDQNQLVILGFPFEVSSKSEYIEIPVFTPAELLEARPNYYAKGENLIYRDYGPKIFLQIGEGDVITMPTSRNCYLYNWSDSGYLSFYGCDYSNKMTAPATFPVTLSADGNTLTIGAMHAGAEYNYGVYRPSVFLDDYKMEACALGDIVLKRK